MTPMTDERKAELEDVIRRIQKLMALGTSPNENEAASAVAKAQELLAKYDLSMESIEDLKADRRTAIKHGDHVMKSTEGKPENWKEELLGAVAALHDCFVIYNYTYEDVKTKKGYRQVKHGKLIGFGHDVEAAGYELAFLTQAVADLAQKYADKMWAEIREIEHHHGISHQRAEQYYVQRTGRHPLKAKLNFLKGATTAVINKLWDSKREREEAARRANPHAIVLRKRDAVLEHYYAEQDGISIEAFRERKAKEKAEYEARQKTMPVAATKPETPEEKATREARERKANEKYNREWRKEWANRDHAAYNSGVEQGSQITTRPGIKDGGFSDREKIG